MELWLPRYAEQAGAVASSSLLSRRRRSASHKPSAATAVRCFPLLSPEKALQSLERLSLSSAPSKILYEMSQFTFGPGRGMPSSQGNRMASNLVSVQVEYYRQPKVLPDVSPLNPLSGLIIFGLQFCNQSDKTERRFPNPGAC